VNGLFEGERAVVVGFGASGRAAVRALLREGATVRVSESRDVDELSADDQDVPEVEVRGGGHRPEHLDDATLVVVSPGVPEGAPVLEWARRRHLPVWSELELGARLCRVPMVAVTGTNGKTTTVELVASAMRAAGLNAAACGNVGYPFSDAAAETFEALAVEASSFQLRFAETFHPRVSVLVNLAPDHLDWHGSLEAYGAAKARIYARQTASDVHVGNADDEAAAALSRQAPCQVRWFRQGPPGAGEVGVVDGHVVSRSPSGEDLEVGRPPRPDHAFLVDGAAAAAAALAFGLPVESVRAAISTAEPGPHRGEVVARIGSLRFVDDSKATNPHAALAALVGEVDAVLIAGGLAKGVDLSPLARSADSLRAVVAIGEAAPQVEAVFRGLVRVRTAASMPEAVAAAYDEAAPVGAVILAPACASMDMFRDYRDRGDRFAQAARELASRVEGGTDAVTVPIRGRDARA
jgi:UDP-N-acetylmuramoylalanine--D-glutamate ligase